METCVNLIKRNVSKTRVKLKIRFAIPYHELKKDGNFYVPALQVLQETIVKSISTTVPRNHAKTVGL